MICPKCNARNDAKHTFCTECGTVIPQIYDNASDEVATVVKRRDELATEMMPPLPTELYSPPNTNRNEALPTQAEVPPTAYIPPVPPTQYYSAPNTERNAPLPRTQIVVPIVSPSNQQSSEPRFVPPKSVKAEIPKFNNPPKDKFEVPKAQNEPKKKSKVFKVGGILLLLLLIGGGIAVYFLAAPMQSSKSYFLTNKPNVQSNTLEFDNQNKTFLMVGAGNDDFQKWQITPDSGNKYYYRFVNRGLGENMSLEVVDDNSDSSVTMAQSAKDVGQLWAITNVKDDYYRITNQWLGDTKSLAHSKQYYYFLRIRDSNSDDGQLWKKIAAPNGKGFYLVNKKHGDTILLQSLKDPDEFKDKLVMKSGEYGNRQWNLNDLGTGFHTLTADGKALDVNSNNKDRVMMNASASSASQNWKMTPVGNDYFRLTNESLGDTKSLEAVTFSALQVQMIKTSDADDGQLWKLTKIK